MRVKVLKTAKEWFSPPWVFVALLFIFLAVAMITDVRGINIP